VLPTAAPSCTAATATCAITPWAWTDGRVQSIFGGITEIMKEIIGRGLGL